MTRLLIILQTIVTRQSVLMPAVAGMLAACYRAFRPKSLDTPDFNTVSNWIFVALGLLAAMLGNLHDQNAKKLDDTKVAVDTNAKILDKNTPPEDKPLTVEAAKRHKGKP